MANFGIIRIQKLKTATSVRASLKHALREQETPNADPEKLANNQILTTTDSVKETIKQYNARLATQDKIRKNAVTCVEFLVTASPEAMKDKTPIEQKAYFDDALNWIKQKHGEENVIFAAIHNDETTPHLTAFVVPIDDRGKLCCKSFYGGSKHVLSELQTEFTEKVAQHHDLDRGIRGSKAKHVSIKDYYARINAPAKEFPKVTAKYLERQGGLLGFGKESNQDVANRLNKDVKEAINARGWIEKGKEIDSLREENKTLVGTLKRYQTLDPLSKVRDILPKSMMDKLDVVIKTHTAIVVKKYQEEQKELAKQRLRINVPTKNKDLDLER